ncbi:LADA_0H08526g1_1 [Lachancea dasiensis]|uniref:LADA_0H08526g1_1 n=1 Tax=Lachancea dasiensis TaxID=1072105 RepID=A0A1G4K2G9_9SACH|nr:LADA_0H08526g1_1 [Lachancea dasiensis]
MPRCSARLFKGMSQAIRYYDIGVNLTDPMYQGIYNGKKYHECDIQSVLHRAKLARVENMLLTGSSIQESRQAIEIAGRYHSEDTHLYYTLGVHPCCVNEFVLKDSQSTIDAPTNDEKFNASLEVTDVAFTKRKLEELYRLMEGQACDPQFRAVGEIGLDYDRLYYSSKKMQLLFFEEQLKISCLFPEKPLFLHMRNCCSDFEAVLKKFIDGFTDSTDRFDHKRLIRASQSTPYMPRIESSGGVWYKFSEGRKFVTHSFTGSTEEMHRVLALSDNSFIGMNGCSFKTQENIDCVREIPLDRLLLETDAPWCDIRRTHDSYKFLYDDVSSCHTAKDDPWDNGLSKAYPDIQKWFRGVKRDKVDKNPAGERDGIVVKSRNEPCFMGHVAMVVAKVKALPAEEVISQVWRTSCEIYGD